MAEGNDTVVVVSPDRSVSVNVRYGVGTGSGDVLGPVSSTDTAIAKFSGVGGDTLANSGVLIDASNNVTGLVDLTPTGIVTVPNTGLHLLDTNASHDLIIAPGSNLTGDRTLLITTGDADRMLDISAGSVTVSAAAATVLDDASVSAMVDTLGGASSTGTGGLVRATSAVLVTPALGTPSAGVLTSCTGLPLTTGVTGTLPSVSGGTGQATVQAAIDALMAASGALVEGDLFYYNGTNVVKLAIGTAGQVLTVNGGGTAPSWV